MRIGAHRRLVLVAAVALAGAYGCEERAGDLPILEEMPTAHFRPASPPLPAGALSATQSVDVLTRLNRGEIALSRYALGRARAQPTRDLAQMMIDQHTLAQANLERWAQTASVASEPNDVSGTIDRAVATVRASLEGAPDDQFDAMFVRAQVEMHQDALRILDERVAPGVRDPQLRTLVGTLRAGETTRLAQARAVADGSRG